MSSNYYYTTLQSVPQADMLEISASFGSNINAGSPVDGDPVYFMACLLYGGHIRGRK